MTVTVYSTGGQDRPSTADIKSAVECLARHGYCVADAEFNAAVAVLRDAARPRPVWPAKEVAEELGVDPANLSRVRGLPEPAQRLARPTARYPDREMRLWFVDEILPLAEERRAKRERKAST